MFIKNLQIKNLRSFKDTVINDLGVPNGNEGSGLNIFIGENGNGKTTVLEAISYLTMSSFAVEGRIEVYDFNEFRKPIEVIAGMDSFRCGTSIDYQRNWYFESSGIKFQAKSRDVKERNKLLSSAFSSHSYFQAKGRYQGTKEVREIDSRDLVFSNSRIIDDGLNIFYFDKNRTRQITSGNYKTTFERILDDLNWKFRKGLDEDAEGEVIKSINGEFFKTVESIVGSSTGRKTARDLMDFFGDKNYTNLKIDSISILQPFQNAFFSLRDDNSTKQILAKNLGSGIEMIFTLLLLRNISGESKGKIIYLIDEPELHLHPGAQSKLLDLLLEESRDKQIFISTHSPYMFKESIGRNANLLLFKRGVAGVEIANARELGWGLFGRFSPTWGEINWFSYNLPTVEFHNELYGYLEENRKEILKSITREKRWLDSRVAQIGMSEDDLERLKIPVSLQLYIRHSIHHPENTYNDKYTDEELRMSIEVMIEKIKYDPPVGTTTREDVNGPAPAVGVFEGGN